MIILNFFLKKELAEIKALKEELNNIENQTFIQKDIEYYSHSVATWYNTRMERDKSILTISAGGLGLLITILNFYGVKNSTEILIYFFGILFFAISIIAMVIIFNLNSKYLEEEINGEKPNGTVLSICDNIGFYSFLLGVIFTFILGCSVLLSTNLNKEMHVIKSKNANKVIKQTVTRGSQKPLFESVQGSSKIRPKKNDKETEKTKEKK